MADGRDLMFSERQQRELEYHRNRAAEHASILEKPYSWDILDNPSRRWWNGYWQMYAHLIRLNLKGQKVLVVGCGFGDDALRLAKLGAEVYAFDLSPESLMIARSLALREGLTVRFEEMAAESLRYDSDFFDCVVARDILHHVEIARAMREIARVSKRGASFVMYEVYSHSVTGHIRCSRLVESYIYPAMKRFIYGPGTPYITEDERKLTETDLANILKLLAAVDVERHFNVIVNRIVPEKFDALAKFDRFLLICARPFGRILTGRILLVGKVSKEDLGTEPTIVANYESPSSL
jgi:ubiquinone/menaquinone biosynthesis C-methylase UbiE